MRGKVIALDRVHYSIRITPAYAGKSSAFTTSSRFFKDHPRLCGEKVVAVALCVRDGGSPPPMRGKAEITRTKFDTVGITPAYAGKSIVSRKLHEHFRDHPRLCGEKCWRLNPPRCHSGSPPPMRGKDDYAYIDYPSIRITPAYAGKRFHRFFRSFHFQDHPRLCGEKYRHVKILGYVEGSPPPMRGKAARSVLLKIVPRITPAYAGKSF